MTTVLADDYLFTGTVASNIRLADPAATDEDIDQLLAAMLLGRSQVGSGTMTGAGGRDLSGGEQRRLHRPPAGNQGPASHLPAPFRPRCRAAPC